MALKAITGPFRRIGSRFKAGRIANAIPVGFVTAGVVSTGIGLLVAYLLLFKVLIPVLM